MPFLDTEAGALYYETTELTPPWIEQPEAILFCHGVATNADIWSDWLPLLADRYRLVRFDTRGFGRSAKAGARLTWSMERLGDDMLAIADATGLGRFHLVGESMGGTAALHLATRDTGRLASVTAVSTSHRGGSIRHVREWRAFIAAQGMERWSSDMMPRRFFVEDADPAMQRWFHSIQATTDPDALLGAAEALIATDLSAILPRIEIPVLLLNGDSSPFVPPTITAEIHGLVAGSEMQIVPRARHGLSCSHGRQCAEALRDFLARRCAR